MSDSSINEELFGKDLNKENSQKESMNCDPPPDYFENDDFQQFIQEKKVKVSKTFGYISCFFYRPFYFSG